MKKLILMVVVCALPAIALAAGSTTTTKEGTNAPAKIAKAEKHHMMELTLTGATEANRTDIEKFAKEANATHASLDVAKGLLKYSGKKFDHSKFSDLLAKNLPTVTINPAPAAVNPAPATDNPAPATK